VRYVGLGGVALAHIWLSVRAPDYLRPKPEQIVAFYSQNAIFFTSGAGHHSFFQSADGYSAVMLGVRFPKLSRIRPTHSCSHTTHVTMQAQIISEDINRTTRNCRGPHHDHISFLCPRRKPFTSLFFSSIRNSLRNPFHIPLDQPLKRLHTFPRQIEKVEHAPARRRPITLHLLQRIIPRF
jgi:hypothetical protein